MPITAFDIEIMEGIKAIIDEDISVHYRIGYLAEKAAMSESRLKLKFKQVFKTGLYSYLLTQRMKLAGELLEAKDKTLQETGRLTGFKYYTNFNRAFKKHFGVTPGEFRRSWE